MVYAAIMTLNGVGHTVATLVTGRYWDGFAGGVTGIGLILIGLSMLYLLGKENKYHLRGYCNTVSKQLDSVHDVLSFRRDETRVQNCSRCPEPGQVVI